MGGVIQTARITGRLSVAGTITGSMSGVETLSGKIKVPSVVGVDPYEGEYAVTPGEETIVLSTGKKYMAENVVVNPIPSNYGKIVWNGAHLRIE